jgi:phosphoribosylanthranilate isomerase
MSRWWSPPAGRVGVKICGVTSAADASAVVAAGADAVGVNFWPGSKRFTDPRQAGPWLRELAGQAYRVAVLVNPDRAALEALAAQGVVDAVQLHGDESPEFCRGLADAAMGFEVVKALRVRNVADIAGLGRFGAAAVLLDTHHAGAYGGTGLTFDWALAAEAVAANPGLPVVLAGGLTPANVAQAVAEARPAAVDVAGGVESAPGVKDLAAVREFVAKAKGFG